MVSHGGHWNIFQYIRTRWRQCHFLELVQDLMQPVDKGVCVFVQEELQVVPHLLLGPFIGHHYHHVVRKLVVDVATAGRARSQFDELGLDGALEGQGGLHDVLIFNGHL